jgi:hypothetical protein
MKFPLPALFIFFVSYPASSLAGKAQAPVSSLQIVSKFIDSLNRNKSYQEEADFLDDDHFKFVSPKANFSGKQDWMKRFPNFHKNAPVFEDPVPGAHDKQVTRYGKKELPLFTLHLTETYELNDEGKIVKISAALKR